jgi:hypothetical protein
VIVIVAARAVPILRKRKVGVELGKRLQDFELLLVIELEVGQFRRLPFHRLYV